MNNLVLPNLDKFKVFPEETLFGTDFTLLAKKRCPICTNKLTEMRKRPDTFLCASKKHKTFIITRQKAFDLVAKMPYENPFIKVNPRSP